MKPIKFERVHIELTNKCNFSCSFCPDSLMSRPRQDIDFGLVQKALDEIARESLSDTIYFHLMGESILYPRLEEAVRAAKTNRLRVSITTNGWAFTPDLLGSILKAGVDEILFSIQTPDKKSFGLRRSTEKFEEYKVKVCQAIAQTLEHGGPKVILSFLTTPVAFILLPTKRYQIIKTKKELVARALEWIDTILQDSRLSIMNDEIGASRSTLMERLNSFSLSGWNKLKLTEKFSFETRVLGDWVHRGLTDDRVVGATVGACEGLKTHFGILSNGDLVFCCVDYDGKTKFGNIKDITIKNAFELSNVQDVLNGFKKFQVKHPYCKRCLGDVGLINSLGRQVGSIFYFRLYRPIWESRRKKEKAICK